MISQFEDFSDEWRDGFTLQIGWAPLWLREDDDGGFTILSRDVHRRALRREGQEVTEIRGEILPYLAAIGSEDGSEVMLAAMEAVGTKFTIKEYTSAGKHEKYLIFAKRGVDFLVLDGVVDTVLFHLRDREEYSAYAHPDALVEGIDHGMSRADVIGVLGEPRRNEKRYLLYAVGDAFVNIQIRDERVLRVNAQRRDLKAEAEAEEAAMSAAGPVPIAGEISKLIGAVGSAYGDPVMLDLVELVGPRLESHDVDAANGGGKFLVFDGGGVDVQYRDDVLIGALVHVREGERRPYPRLDALIDGLSFPATRADVHAVLGVPVESPRSDVDVYEHDGRFVLFNYDDDDLATISITIPFAAP